MPTTNLAKWSVGRHSFTVASPKKVATVSLTSPPLRLACGDDCLYALSKSGLHMLDLADCRICPILMMHPGFGKNPLIYRPVCLPQNEKIMTIRCWITPHPIMKVQPRHHREFFRMDGWFPWGLLYSFGNAFSPWNSSNTKGYGPVASAYSSLYGFPSTFGPWLGSAPYSSSGSYAYALGAVNSLDGGDNSTSSDYGYLNFPFCSFSGSDGYFPFGLVPPPSVSFY